MNNAKIMAQPLKVIIGYYKVVMWLLTVSIMCGFSSFSAAGCLPQAITSSMEGAPNIKNLSILMLEDSTQKLTFEDVSGFSIDRFTPTAGVVDSAVKGGSIWLKLCLDKNLDAREHWILSVLPAYIKKVELYEIIDNKLNRSVVGDVTAWDKRKINYRGYAFHLDFSRYSEKTIYLKLDFHHRISADIMMIDGASMYDVVADDYLKFGMYFSIVLIVFLANLILSFRTKNKSYFYYSMCILFLSSFTILNGGYLYQSLFSDEGMSAMPAIMVSICLYFCSLHLFFNAAYELESNAKLLNIANYIFAAGYVIISVCYLISNDLLLYRIVTVIYMASIPVFFGMVVYDVFWLKKHRFFSLSLVPVLLAFVLSSARSFGMSDSFAFVEEIPAVASLVHMITTSIILAKKAWFLESEKSKAVKELLRFSREYSSNLERDVDCRTKDLALSNEKLNNEIESRRLTEDRLREAIIIEQKERKMKREFVAILSHELRAPVSAIDMAVQNLEFNLSKSVLSESETSTSNRIESIKKSTNKLNRIIENTIVNDKLLRIDCAEIEVVEVELFGLIAKTVSTIDFECRVDLSGIKEEMMAKVDVDLVQIALSNLIDNALKYSDKCFPVKITMMQVDDCVEISVIDNGEEISEDEKRDIFEKYYRSHTAHGNPGSGLGLFLTKMIAEKHKGSIKVITNDSNVGGNTFVLRLPI
ncbi:sensor histidine kinase [Gilvimarinus sp. 1_MG-2023]|uniref:sensor histidine kinase n=1 Tax=Gilvimarinus sp. 1_MG-2023 TaxID=3062638 RepID=UPI0026E277A9|nr:sensor histidine kinase [Gilvimarinus sp. 1_MG-2023]MDO6746566.1 sensor histidine kinase [Gilvimarinus sp. 1_MG-2023]